MRDSLSVRPIWAMPFLLLAIAWCGCTRSKYRVAADREAYGAIAERNGDPRWSSADLGVEMDPRSRYFDPYNLDCPPMPQDDPAAHQYMQRVNGMKGWAHWYDNGVRAHLENPNWQELLGGYVELDENGAVKLDVDSALRLGYVHSPNHQSQLETLYLSSLDVSTERFRLDTQYFGGYDLNYFRQGPLIPPALRFDPTTGRFIVNPAIEARESNRLTVGRPFAENPALQASRRYATAGQLLTGFANSFVFEFTGNDANLSASLINLSFLQPLLRGAGRDIALEQLTFNERALLANLRSYAQFRQGFYTLIAIGELGVSGPQRGGRGTSLQVFSGQGRLDGYVGLLQQLQQIRNSEDNLNLQLRTLARLEALLEGDLIDLVQVDQFRQSIESERASLLQRQNSYLSSLDTYKARTLGLPPDLPIELDDSLIRQFQLVGRDATEVQNAIAELQAIVGELPDEPDSDAIRALQTGLAELLQLVRRQLETAQSDLDRFQEAVPDRRKSMTPAEAELFASEIEQLEVWMSDVEREFAELEQGVVAFQTGQPNEIPRAEEPAEPDQALPDTAIQLRDAVVLLREMVSLVQGTILVQARSRLESVTVESINLSSQDAFEIALANRLDFMNGRAALVDSWRLIQVNADALQSVLNVTANGDIRTARNNPVSFRAPTANLQLGLEFDAPLTRLVERNNYRESLISYQRSRRDYIQSRDSLHLDLRVLLREIEQFRTNLEIQRRAVAIAIRRVDLTSAALDQPVPPPQPGQRAAQFGPTAAINLLSAQSALRDTQNAFLDAWLNYYAAKMRLARELGVMTLDYDGRWIETPPPSSGNFDADGSPPALPEGLLEAVDSLPEGFTFDVEAGAFP